MFLAFSNNPIFFIFIPRASLVEMEITSARSLGGRSVTIVYNGEIYNMKELKKELQHKGVRFHPYPLPELFRDSRTILLFPKRRRGCFA